jgi:chromodomain-helicase-DNA-binding protein 4
MPTALEVCESFGLQDVELDFASDDFQNINAYKQFQQLVRPILQKENPKVLIITAFEFIYVK